MQYEYLLFNALVFFSPFLSSLFYKHTIWPNRKKAIISISVIAIPFILIDAQVTGIFWIFNQRFIFPFQTGDLPFEEMLFFFTVPFSCLMLWKNGRAFYPEFSFHESNLQTERMVFLFAAGISALAHIWYTTLVCILVFCVFQLHVWLKSRFFFQFYNLMFLGISGMLTIVFDGYLTGRQIVIYNPAVKTSLQLGTIPIEDIVYSLCLISLVLIVYEALENRDKRTVKNT